MKFCKKCEKQTPTSSKNGTEECMVCGTILLESEITKKSVIDLRSNPKSSNISKSKDIADAYSKSKEKNNFQKNKNSDYIYQTCSPSKILGGIMIMILGFSALTIGNYIIMAISESLSATSVNSNDQMINTTNDVMNYAITVIPLFGLALMVLGFATILFTLRESIEV